MYDLSLHVYIRSWSACPAGSLDLTRWDVARAAFKSIRISVLVCLLYR